MSATPDGSDRSRLIRTGRIFAFTIMAGFVFLALVSHWRFLPTLTLIAQAVAVTSFVAGVLIPARLEPIRRGWMKLGDGIGRVTTPVLLATVYYLVLTPTAILHRAFARRRPSSKSYWHPREPLPDKSRLERQF